MKTQKENPNGLHQRFIIKKIITEKNPNYRKLSEKKGSIFSKREKEYITKIVNVNPEAEYFVLRLDVKGKDLKQINACRIAINAYAEAIKEHIPQLAMDLLERYPLLTPPNR